MKTLMCILLAVLYGELPLWAQVVTTETTNNQTGVSDAATPWLPTAVNGETAPLQLPGDGEQMNQLAGGVTLASSYDDNARSYNVQRLGNISYEVFPYISITEARSRTLWNLNYSPGFTLNQRTLERRSLAQNLDAHFQYRLSERFTIRLQDEFIQSTSSLNPFILNPPHSGGNLLAEPNNTVSTPLSERIGNSSDADLIYQPGENSIVGVSGVISKLHFQNTIANGPVALIDGDSGAAEAFYGRRLSQKNSVGVTYALQKITALGILREHTVSHSVSAFYRVDLTSKMFVSILAGPDRSVTNDLYTFALGPFLLKSSSSSRRWLLDEGLSFGWEGNRTSVRSTIIHHITDGGGVTGAVELYDGSFEARQQLNMHWSGMIGARYGNNTPLSSHYGSDFSGLTATAGVERSLGESFSVQLQYARAHQNYASPLLKSYRILADHNWVGLNISYHFSRPLGW